MNVSRSTAARLENLISWFAASAVVTAGVLYALKRQENTVSRAPAYVPPRASPAQEPISLQRLRATEAGRGRRADAPTQIPRPGWKDVIVRTYHEVQDDRLLALAAGVAFYSLVALFPALAAGVSVYALFADAATISKHLSAAANVIPASRPRHPEPGDHAAGGEKRQPAHSGLFRRPWDCPVERQCRDEGDLRRAQYHL